MPKSRMPAETVARFDAVVETFTSISPPSLDEYRLLLEAAQGRAETDRVVQALARVEQAYWRQLVFGSVANYPCAICGRRLPIELLVAAHIKQRSRCSHKERLDPENIIAACLLGCDALFEKGYIRVENGIVRINCKDRDSALAPALTVLAGKRVSLGSSGWTEIRAGYFNSRQACFAVRVRPQFG
jgi:hypothetical protein